MDNKVRVKKEIGLENLIFIVLFFGFFIAMGSVMGGSNMLMTLMNTAFSLLMNTCFYIMAISVIAGAVSALFSEFGFVALVNKVLSRIMGPIYDLPGAASLGVLNCYLSDNPAILTLAQEKNFLRYFKLYQLPALTNLGTAFGMGLITTTTMLGMHVEGALKGALIGNLGAIIGSVISVRIMIHFTKKRYGTTARVLAEDNSNADNDMKNVRVIREGGVGSRFIGAMLDGGKSGVDMGIAIIPGVLCICSLVMLLTNGPGPDGLYTGEANQGVPVLPWIGEKLSFILSPLFGFTNPQSISVPITALGSAGAAIGVIKTMSLDGLVTGNDIAVFTAICMCWSGYLSTHIAMMDALDKKESTGNAILAHTIGGFMAGVAAHLIYLLIG